MEAPCKMEKYKSHDIVKQSYKATNRSELTNRTVDRSNATADRSNVTADRSNVTEDGSNVTADRSNVTADRSNVTADRSQETDDRWLQEGFNKTGRPTFLHINLDTMLNNIKVIRSYISLTTDIIAVVKGNAYGHGSVHVARFLQQNGITCFAVATAQEGHELRTSGIKADIIVLTPTSEDDVPRLLDDHLVPTVADMSFLETWYTHLQTRQRMQNNGSDRGHVMISVDTGITTNGCRLTDLPRFMQFCKDHEVPIHSMMTHLVDSWADLDLSHRQLDMFLRAVQPYRARGVRVHVANTCAVYHGIGVDLDFVRTGVAIYGQPLDSTADSCVLSRLAGFRPVLSWYARSVRIVDIEPGQTVGYYSNFVSDRHQRIAVLPVGYTDGYSKCLCKARVTTIDGAVCPVVGLVSMDTITVLLADDISSVHGFCMMSDDYNDVNSTAALATVAKTTTSEMCVRLNSKRLPRLYTFQGEWFTGES